MDGECLSRQIVAEGVLPTADVHRRSFGRNMTSAIENEGPCEFDGGGGCITCVNDLDPPPIGGIGIRTREEARLHAQIAGHPTIRSMTGGGAAISLGLTVSPFILASISSCNASW